MSHTPRIGRLVLAVLVPLSLVGAALAAADGATDGKVDAPPWMFRPTLARIEVIGESLLVVLTDPHGRRDSSSESRPGKQIPDCERWTGSFNLRLPPYVQSTSVYESSFQLNPIPGKYKVDVWSPSRRITAQFRARRPFFSRGFIRDSVMLEPGDHVRWTVEWGSVDPEDSLLVRVQRTPPARRRPSRRRER